MQLLLKHVSRSGPAPHPPPFPYYGMSTIACSLLPIEMTCVGSPGHTTSVSHFLCPTFSSLFSSSLKQGSVFSVSAAMSTLEALSQMARDHKSSLGVVDPATGQLISNLSVSDLRSVGALVGCAGSVTGVLLCVQ